MKDDKELYLTDAQYLDLLKKARASLDDITEIDSEDSTQIGNKHTVSNVGLCAGIDTGRGWYKDKFTTLETAMWRKEFKKIGKVKYESPQMFSMKYRGEGHRCPLEHTRPFKKGFWGGCFYRCRVFQKKEQTPSLAEIKELYDKEIEVWSQKLK